MNFTWTPVGAIAALLMVLAIGLAGERRLALRRRALQRLYQFGEQLLSSRSIAENLRLLESALPELLGVTEVRIYLQDRASRALRRLESVKHAASASAPSLAEEHVRFRQKSAELCFRNRSLIAAPDTRRSPLFEASEAAETPRSMVFVPMFAKEDLLGVLAVGHSSRVRQFNEDERAVLQHLSNQVAIGLKLLEQKSLRSQSTGGERLDAQCRLIATAGAELKQPLSAITGLAQALAARAQQDACSAQARQIASQATLASGMLSWLLRFAGLLREPGQVTDLAAILRRTLDRREEDWRERGVQLRNLVSAESILVAAPAGTLEHLFSSLLRHAEARLAESGGCCLTVRALPLASTAQVDLTWPALPSEVESPDSLSGGQASSEDVLGLAVCRDLVLALGGQMKLAMASDGSNRLEVELPVSEPDLLGSAGIPPQQDRRAAPLTCLVLEPEQALRQALITSLGNLGHRVVPITSAEEAIDLAGRMPFHVIFCSSSVSGTTWLECLQATRDRIRAFILLTKGHEADLAAALPAGGAYALAMPPRAEELARLLDALE